MALAIFLLIMVFAAFILSASWGGSTPLGVCHRCGLRVTPPAMFCADCRPKPKTFSPAKGPKIPPMKR